MRCRFGRQLPAYLAHELPLQQRELLERHLAQCPRCAHELEGLARVERLLAELAPAPVPEHLAATTLHRLRTYPSAPTLLFRHAPSLAAAVAAAACLLMALHVMLPQTGPGESPLHAVAPAEIASPVAMAIVPAVRAEARRRDEAASAVRVTSRPAPRRTVRTPARTRKALVRASVAPVPASTRADAEERAVAALNAVRRHARESDPDLMVAALENVALAYPGTTPAVQALLTAGDVQRQRGNLAEADANYRRLLGMKSAGRMPRALAHKALADLRSESVGDDEVTRYHYQEAARVLRGEARTGASRRQALLAMADIARETGNRDEAVADYAAVANQGAGEQAVTSLAEVL